jgi:hypothetical protein
VLQRDAAGFTRAAKARSDAEVKRLAELKYRNDQKSIYDKDIAPGTFVLDTMNMLAKRGLRPAGGNPLIDPMNGQLYQFDAGDVQDMLGMIANLTEHDDPVGGKKGTLTSVTDNVLYHTDDGKPFTGTDFLNKLKSFGYTGKTLTLDGMYAFVSTQRDGLVKAQHLAEKTGHLTDAQNFAKAAATNGEIGREIKAWPVEQNYLSARETRNRVLNDPSSSQQDIKTAVDEYRSQLLKYADDPAVASNDVFRNKLIAEANGDETVTTLAEDFTGLNTGTPAKDVADTNIKYDRAVAQIDAVANGEGQIVWTTGEYDKQTHEFKPGPGGSSIGAATQQDILNHSGGVPTQTIFMPDKGGRFSPVTVMGQPITAHSYGADGSELPIKDGTNPVVGYVYATPNGRQMVSYSDGGKPPKTLVSDIKDSPWGSGATLTENGKGFDLRISAPSSADQLANSGFTIETDSQNRQKMVYDPKAAMLATDKEHANLIVNGGGDPHTDFRSINMAYYASDVEGHSSLTNLNRNPAFRAEVDAETRVATGFTGQVDPKTGAVTWTGGDQTQLDRGFQQNGNTVTGGRVMGGTYEDRSVPAAELTPDQRYENGGINQFNNLNPLGYAGDGAPDPLASTQLAGSSFSKMVGHLQTGTLTPKPDAGTSQSGFGDIKLGNTLKVPTPPQINAITGFTVPGATLSPTATTGGGAVNPTSTDGSSTSGNHSYGRYGF